MEFIQQSIQDVFIVYREPLILAGGGLAGSLVLSGLLLLIRWLLVRRGYGLPAVLAGAQKLLPPLLFLGALSLAAAEITFPEGAEFWVEGLFSVLVTAAVVISLNGLLDWFIRRSISAEAEPDGKMPPRLRSLVSLLHLLVWAVGILFVLDNFGFNISAVVAGLGISGIAVAIAAQGILGDLFNYLVIHFDRPFELGDFIVFEDKLGTVEKVGVKTTRIRALTGEQLVVANSDLTGSRVHNYKKMEERRIVFSFGVTYQTPTRKLRALPDLIRQVIEEESQARFDRAHFSDFGASALMFENVYYVLSPDYAVFRDVQQRINLRLKELLDHNGIALAYPTQTVYVRNTPSQRERPEGPGKQEESL